MLFRLQYRFSFTPPNFDLPGVVDVVDEVLNDGGGVGELDGFGVMGDNDARDGLDSNNTLLVLIASMDLVYSPSCETRPCQLRAYLFAVQTTVVGSDDKELVTSNGETVGLSRARVPEASCQTANLLGRNLKK